LKAVIKGKSQHTPAAANYKPSITLTTIGNAKPTMVTQSSGVAANDGL
jgi:hypothetical protein